MRTALEFICRHFNLSMNLHKEDEPFNLEKMILLLLHKHLQEDDGGDVEQTGTRQDRPLVQTPSIFMRCVQWATEHCSTLPIRTGRKCSERLLELKGLNRRAALHSRRLQFRISCSVARRRRKWKRETFILNQNAIVERCNRTLAEKLQVWRTATGKYFNPSNYNKLQFHNATSEQDPHRWRWSQIDIRNQNSWLELTCK